MKSFDIYGNSFQLHVAGNYTISSTFGGLLSFLTLILMLVYIFFNGSDIFYRTNPNIYQENLTSNVSHSINFTDTEFRFYFNLQFGANRSVFDDPTYVKFKFVNKIRKNGVTNKTYISFKKCFKDYFQNLESEESIIDRLIEKQYNCPDLTNFILSGSWVENIIQYGQIQVYPCNNNTDNVICKPLEDIKNFIWFNRIFISVYYPLSLIRLGIYDDPIDYDLKEDYYYIGNMSKYKFYTYAIDKISIATDSGILFSSIDDLNGLSMKPMSNDERIINVDDPYIFSIDFYSSFNTMIYQRSYIKILDIVSNFGGMIGIITLIFQSIVSIFYTLQRTQFLTEKIFILEDPSNKKNTLDENIIKKKLKFLKNKSKESQKIELSNKNSSEFQNTKIQNKQDKEPLNNQKEEKQERGNLNNKNEDKQSEDNLNNQNQENKEIEMSNLKNSTNHGNLTKNMSCVSLINNEEKIQASESILENSKILKENLDNTTNLQNENAKTNINILNDSERQILNTTNQKDEILITNNNKDPVKSVLKEEKKDLQQKKLENLTDIDKQNKNDKESQKRIFYIKKLIQNKETDPLNMSCFQKFRIILKCFLHTRNKKANINSKLLMLYKEIDYKIENYFDFLNIIKNTEESNLLKNLLLNDKQRLLVELLRKPILTVHDREIFNENCSVKDFEEKKLKNEINEDDIIEAVNELLRLYKREVSRKKSKNSMKISQNFIEILENKFIY